MLLADLGAAVIKVEPPWGDPWRGVQAFAATESRPFIAYNRGKRSLTLDLTTAAARDILARLIPQTDVALVNYRPDVAAKLGVDYAALAALNPRLIYCENTAFGRRGPDAHRPGYDLILQAMSGLMTAEGKLNSSGVPQHIVAHAVGGHRRRPLPGLVRLRRPLPSGAHRPGAKGGNHAIGLGFGDAGDALCGNGIPG